MFKHRITIIACALNCLLISACNNSDQEAIEPNNNPTPETSTAETVPDHANISIIYNTTIYTVAKDQAVVEAVAFDANGVIVAVGNSSDLLARYPGAQLHDLQQRGAVVPGLIDAHGHLMNLGFRLLSADLSGTKGLPDILQRLQAKAADLPADAWLTGGGWDQNDWVENPADAQFPTSADLDDAFPDRPVWLARVDGHAGWANSKAMQLLSAEALSADPAGGRIIRHPNGQPTGVFIDAATDLIDAQVPTPDVTTRQLALKAALQEANRFGLTGVHEAGTSLENFRLYQQSIADNEFTLRLYAMADGDNDALDWICENQPVINSQARVQMRAIKFYLDGALGSRGAALIDDYHDEPGNRGLLFATQEEFAPLVERSMACGLQVNTHAIGDLANRVLLNTYAQALSQYPNNPGRHRIEHAQVLHPDDFAKTAELGLIASMQPTHATSDMYWAEDRLGAERVKGAYAWQTFKATDVRLALGSDFPVESANPILGFYAAVSRQDNAQWPNDGWYPAQRLTRQQALQGFTLDAAYAGFMADQVGSLEVGKQADFVWLSDDIMTIEAIQIPATQVLETWLAGEKIYSH